MNGVVIAAAGSGSRTGLKDNKIFFMIDGKTMLEKTVGIFKKHPAIDKICVVCAEKDWERVKSLLPDITVTVGGETRGASVLSGLQAIGPCDKVLIHDAARPFTDEQTVTRVLEAIGPQVGAVAGVPVTDTIKQTDGTGVVTTTPERKTLWAAQTPQGFLYREILSAYETAGTLLTDDAAVFEKAGGRVQMVPGDYANKKITTAEDVKMPKMLLTGIGYDVHKLVENRKLFLGGVEIPHTLGLDGHSDADVLVHAVMDAMLGAACLGDIGQHFPDTDPQYKGISSMLLLEHVTELLKNNGFKVVNISAIVAAQKPKMAPFIARMNQNIARVTGTDFVNVAATTTEHLGFEGRQEGISARALVTVEKD